MKFEKQIDVWSRRPSSILPGWTVQVLRDALHHAERLHKVHFKIFVQGSYANETNVEGDSDVDLVIQLKTPFEEEVSRLTATERRLFYQHYSDADYTWQEFREDVVSSLRQSYFVAEGSKCVDVRDWDSLLRIPADILPAIEYRSYKAFPSLPGEVYSEGVFFRDASGRPIRNFPKQHLLNGRTKNQVTRGRFKEIVRVAKKARSHESAGLAGDIAPSYFIECLFYNVPDECYLLELETAYRSCISWLTENTEKMPALLCQNEITKMFGDAPDQWSIRSAEELLNALDRQQATYH